MDRKDRRAYDRMWKVANRKKNLKKNRKQDNEYYHKNKDRKLKNYNKNKEKYIERIAYYRINKRNNDKGFGDTGFSLKEFRVWYSQKDKKCTYCDIDEHLMPIGFWGNRSKITRLTIDRKNSSKEYKFSNMCFACETCNVLKSNFFTTDEFREIAQKYIKPRWEEIIFPNIP